MGAPKFEQISQALSDRAGKPSVFFAALFALVVWGISGPFFHFNDTWQLIVNTSTSIITFLMVFLIQNAQNRDSDALHVKLDELIKATVGAKNELMAVDKENSDELKQLRENYLEQGESGAKALPPDGSRT